MKLKSNTLILIIAALVLGGFVYFYEIRGASQREAAEAESQDLFDFEESQVQALTLTTSSEEFSFERDEDGNWQMQEPEPGAANEASVAYLLNLLATGESDRTLTTAETELEEFGFEQPLATVEVTLDDQETHRLILGGYNFDRSWLYAQADPSTDAEANSTDAETDDAETATVPVLLVSPDFANAVNRPSADWRQAEAPASPAPATPAETSPPEASPSGETSPEPVAEPTESSPQ